MPINDPEKSENMRKSIRVYSGSSNRPLAQKIAEYLGVELSGLTLKQFANGEIYARYDETVRGADVFLIQSVAGGNVNDMLMELLIATDAAKRASARSITAVITHYGYARQDRKAGPREPITARLVANLLERAGVNRIITLDLHQGQIQGFFDIPVNHLSSVRMFGDCGRLDAELEHLLRELRLLQDLIHRTPLLLGPPNRASTEMDGSPNKTVRAQALCRHTVQIIPSWTCHLRVSSAVGSRVYPLRPAKGGEVYFGRFYQAKRSNKTAGCKTSVPVSIRRIHGYQLSSS